MRLKEEVFPLFFWLPASYHTPPIAVSAIFAGLLTKVGVYALIRVFTLIFVQDTNFIIFGSVYNLKNIPLVVRASLNGTMLTEIDTFATGSGEWDFNLHLTEDSNTISIKAFNMTSTLLNEKSVIFFYNGDFVDTIGPKIQNIKIGGVIIEPNIIQYVPDDSITVQVVAFDEASHIADIFIMGEKADKITNKEWQRQIVVSHDSST